MDIPARHAKGEGPLSSSLSLTDTEFKIRLKLAVLGLGSFLLEADALHHSSLKPSVFSVKKVHSVVLRCKYAAQSDVLALLRCLMYWSEHSLLH